MKKLTVYRSAIATTEESETFAVRRVKTRPSVTSSRTIESRPFKSTSRLARNGGRSRPAADYGNANSRNPPFSPACAGYPDPQISSRNMGETPHGTYSSSHENRLRRLDLVI